jgi:hypothetical protein
MVFILHLFYFTESFVNIYSTLTYKHVGIM